jgi:putative membrane protein
MGTVALLAVTTLALASERAWAHAADAPAVTAPWQWNTEPWLLLLLVASIALYALGLARLWRHSDAGRGISRWQAASFASGWIALVIALVSPLDALGGQLFSAHMLQHEMLMIVAAPLLVLGRPVAAWTWAFAPATRRQLGRATQAQWFALPWAAITQPVAAWALHAIALWLWHVPALFEAALHSEAVHVAQHTSFLATALLFWWAVLGADVRARGSGWSIAYLFTTMMHTSALGALLSLAPTLWYPSYAATSRAFGMDPVEDQQLGGLVMWVPGGLAYLIAGLATVARLLTRPALNPSSAVRPGLPR